jgi:hypothetical protein
MAHPDEWSVLASKDEARELAGSVAKSDMFKSVKTPQDAYLILWAGAELELSAMQALRSIHVIEGKPTLSADLMVALVQRSPLCDYWRLVSSTLDSATYETKRRDASDPVRLTYTIEEARVAGLTTKNTWQRYQAQMLRAATKRQLAREVYPELLAGIYSPDEVGALEAPDGQVLPVLPQPPAEAIDVDVERSGDVDVVDVAPARHAQGAKVIAREEMRAAASGWATALVDRGGAATETEALNAIRARLRDDCEEPYTAEHVGQVGAALVAEAEAARGTDAAALGDTPANQADDWPSWIAEVVLETDIDEERAELAIAQARDALGRDAPAVVQPKAIAIARQWLQAEAAA